MQIKIFELLVKIINYNAIFLSKLLIIAFRILLLVLNFQHGLLSTHSLCNYNNDYALLRFKYLFSLSMWTIILLAVFLPHCKQFSLFFLPAVLIVSHVSKWLFCALSDSFFNSFFCNFYSRFIEVCVPCISIVQTVSSSS